MHLVFQVQNLFTTKLNPMKHESLPTCQNFLNRYNEVIELKKRIKHTLRPIEQQLLKEELNDLLLHVIDCVKYNDDNPDCLGCKALIEIELRLANSARTAKLPV